VHIVNIKHTKVKNFEVKRTATIKQDKKKVQRKCLASGKGK
jgi:hypothetical protein